MLMQKMALRTLSSWSANTSAGQAFQMPHPVPDPASLLVSLTQLLASVDAALHPSFCICMMKQGAGPEDWELSIICDSGFQSEGAGSFVK